jgi:hypothetical protein
LKRAVINRFIVPLILAVLWSSLSQAQVCGELFRSTPELEGVVSRPFTGFFGGDATSMDAKGPNQTRLLRAVEADVLGFKLGFRGWPARALYSMKRTFFVIGAAEARGDLATVEFHRRQYERRLAQMGLPVRRDIRTRLRENKHYLSLAFSAAANGAVNFLAYKYLSSAGILIHIPATRIFNERSLPDDVLNELIEAKSTDDTPKTRAYVRSKIKFGADEVIAAGRRMFNFGILAVLIFTHGDLITDPEGASIRLMDTTTSQIREAAREQNKETLQLLYAKRAKFLAEGQLDKVAKADALILEVQNQKSNSAGLAKQDVK